MVPLPRFAGVSPPGVLRAPTKVLPYSCSSFIIWVGTGRSLLWRCLLPDHAFSLHVVQQWGPQELRFCDTGDGGRSAADSEGPSGKAIHAF